MVRYIELDALVAEIERMIKHYNESAKEFGDEGYNDNVLMEQCKANTCEHILSFIDTLEVKEVGIDLGDPKWDRSAKCIIDTNTLEVKDVDLEKEIDRYYNIEAPKEFEDVLYEDIEKFAKHFFELGLKIQKGE